MTTSRKWCFSALLAIGARLGAPAPALAASFSANPVSDAFVASGPSGNLAGNNYGGAGALGLSASALSKGEFQSVLQFDLTPARSSFDSQFGAGQWSAQSVSLRLTAAAPNNALLNANSSGQFQVFWMQNDSWTEGSGTPAAPGASGITLTSLKNSFIGAGDESLGTFAFNGVSCGSADYTLNLTPGFAADLAAGHPVSLRLAAADNGVSYLFDSRSFGTAASRPSLSVTAVPEPGAAALGALGISLLAGLGLSGRRRMTA